MFLFFVQPQWHKGFVPRRTGHSVWRGNTLQNLESRDFSELPFFQSKQAVIVQIGRLAILPEEAHLPATTNPQSARQPLCTELPGSFSPLRPRNWNLDSFTHEDFSESNWALLCSKTSFAPNIQSKNCPATSTKLNIRAYPGTCKPYWESALQHCPESKILIRVPLTYICFILH